MISIVVLSGLVYLTYYGNTAFSKLDIEDFEIGMVADRDITAGKNIEYIDEKATEIRNTAARHSVTAVFDKDVKAGITFVKEYLGFSAFIIETKHNAKKLGEFKFMVLEEYPRTLDEKELELLFNSSSFSQIMDVSTNLLKKIYEKGVADMSILELKRLNDSKITVIVQHNDTQSYENIPIDEVIFYDKTEEYIKSVLEDIKMAAFEKEVLILLKPFIRPNILYNAKETEARIAESLSLVKPVIVTINKNQRILRRGFVINEEIYNQLKAYSRESDYFDVRHFMGAVLFLVMTAAVSLLIFSKNILGKSLEFKFNFLILLFFDFVYAVFLFISKLSFFAMPLNLVPALPVAFFAMLAAVLISQKVALYAIFILSLAVFGASDYKMVPALFSVFSGLSATALIHITGKRMDLIKTACLLTVIQPIIVICFMVMFRGLTSDATAVILGTALNGFISGIFVLGFLPILETALNTSTSFRLIELSDLNSPIMKRMLINISGTYNHSMMVATLAEAACQEIGANSLLARVGAYYHDIGKMDVGEYFVENQTLYNKHLDLNPRLSATVIRSHVKLGVEKAKQLRLPQQVVDIISEHHGNSLVYYFYAKAKEQDPTVKPEDFAYPGTPPSSKESAVVMLADTVEAACHTLDKPTESRLQKFIDELVTKKAEAGQLDNSDLTFREITVIKETFVKILTGYYHSRIKYPNQKNIEDEQEKESEQTVPKNIELINPDENIKGNNNA